MRGGNGTAVQCDTAGGYVVVLEFWKHAARTDRKVQRAVKLVQDADPTLMIDGEKMADTAVVAGIVEETYPFSKRRGGANLLVFPDLTSANTCYKLLSWIDGAERIGPILKGMSCMCCNVGAKWKRS